MYTGRIGMPSQRYNMPNPTDSSPKLSGLTSIGEAKFIRIKRENPRVFSPWDESSAYGLVLVAKLIYPINTAKYNCVNYA